MIKEVLNVYENNTTKNTTPKKRTQHLAFPVYDEEVLLNWNAAIVTLPPRCSGTIRVKLNTKDAVNPFPSKFLGRIGIGFYQNYGNR